MTVWSVHISCWIPKATDLHSEYVILIAFPLQHWLHEGASMLRYAYSLPCNNQDGVFPARYELIVLCFIRAAFAFKGLRFKEGFTGSGRNT